MEISPLKCPVATNGESRWPYQQYYFGDKDKEQRRHGRGENHWSGAESLEWYTGKFIRDTMHGRGEYRWRYKGPEGTFLTYEGRFYGNNMHGYGLMSYPDGRVFSGLFYNNMRWGPGVETSTTMQENVGLWRGDQLVRIPWRPNTPSVTMDFHFATAPVKTIAEVHRTLLATTVRNIGEVNSAIELLKESGASPVIASEKWSKLYPRNCNDFASQMCHVDLFNQKYYHNTTTELEEIEAMPETVVDRPRNSKISGSNLGIYYAWNNSEVMVSMMKHAFKHEHQRHRSSIHLLPLLSGSRSDFKHAGKHEFDCRNLILSSYLGYIHRVAQLVNEENVHPDVADKLGNTAVMYATCGNQTSIINFLVEAGANVDNFNDSCCTPLAVALLLFACLNKDVPPNCMTQVLVPPPQSAGLPYQETPSEWYITRDVSTLAETGQLNKISSKSKLAQKPAKSSTTLSSQKDKRKQTPMDLKKRKSDVENSTHEAIIKEEDKTFDEKLFNELSTEFCQKVEDLFLLPGKLAAAPTYLYEVMDLARAVDGNRDDRDRAPQKLHTAVTKDVIKPSKDVTGPDSEKEESVSSEERARIEMLSKSEATIFQLLSDGADPRLVRCPQPALLTAVMSGSAELVRRLVQHGADVNEVFPKAMNYTILDIAVTRPLTLENLALVRSILECGGTADHRLRCDSLEADTPGPTLLHAVLTKRPEDSAEEQISCQLLELLLEYGCNPLEQYRGSSATDMATSKSSKLFEIFIKSPQTDLNAIINGHNQTILVKMFSLEFYRNIPIAERLQTLTNLLLYGADPLLECQNKDSTYGNLFVFAQKNLLALEGPKVLFPGQKPEGKKAKKPQPAVQKVKEDTRSSKTPPKPSADELADYKQALCLMRDCARILHIRWIQAKLMRELLGVVEKFEHRHWSMILPEHKNMKPCGLWLTMARCLEIWDIFKENKKKQCNDRRVLKHILCMVHYYCNRSKSSFKCPLTAVEKDIIETDVFLVLREHKIAREMTTSPRLSKPYVTPELAVGNDEKFQICFECALPLPENTIQCKFCKQVSFCALECMKTNLLEQNVGVHPCNQNLISKYFPSPLNNSTQTPHMIT